MPASALAIAIGLGVVLGGILAAAYAYYARTKMGNLDKQREQIVQEAERTAASMIKEAKIESKDIIFQAKQDAEKDFKERKNELTQLERTLRRKEEVLDKKIEQTEQRDAEFSKREKGITSREQALDQKITEQERLVKEQVLALERISGQTADQAKAELMRRVEEESRLEAARVAKRIEDEARENAEKKAVEIISNSIQRYSSDYISDAAVSSVSLPNDELKGRIIGREGRNIRALEAAAGVDLIVDDTPEVVTISAFDPVRREIARKALEKLISDGRIHPARIEELVEKAKKEVNTVILEEGEKAVFDVGLSSVHPELIKILGRLKYRTSYGQNVLEHSKEVSFLAGMMAGELGVDIKTAKRGGLLHDIGKAIDHEMEGSHVEIGVNVARKYGEKDKVLNAIQAHHGDVETTSVEAALVAAADALSAARPGVRRESIENYIKRLENLEKLANSFAGVEKSYAIQAGREIRIIVKPESVDDEASWKIAKELSKRIESEMTYPGQIKVTVIRESRYVEFAK